jgi:pimeloyl-ACP methyl ester carboxylesterase/class 3 adenylate cyclase
VIPETRYAKMLDGVRIAYQVFGRGEHDLLYVPGLITHLELHWEDPRYAAFLNGLGSLARVIAIDRRGVGLSDRLSPEDLPPVEVIVDDLITVLDEVGSVETALVGHDDGGQVGLLLAASHPERLRGLVVYATSPSTVGRPNAPWSDSREAWEAWLTWTVEHYGSRESAIRDIQETSGSRSAGDEYDIEWIAKLYRYGASPSAFLALHRLSMQLDVTDVLPTISIPSLFIHRREDRIIDVEASRFMAAAVPGARLIELDGGGHFPNQGEVAPLIDAVRSFISGTSEHVETTRHLATVLFTDIADSTRHASELGDSRWKEVLLAHHERTRTQLGRYRGTEVDTAGDGFLATFDGPAAAIRCATAILQAVRSLGIEVRAGIHTGEVETISGKVGGIAVHIGARVSSLADPGAVLVSSTVKDLAAGSGIRFEDRGEHVLKGVLGEWRLYAVESD